MRWAIGLLAVLACCATIGAAPRSQRAADAYFERLRTSMDVAWLERLVSDDDAVETETPKGYSPKSTRQLAYVRLGAIGTPEAIAAIRRIETTARSWKPWSDMVNLDRMPHPSGHFGDYAPRPFVQIADLDGLTHGLIATSLLGGSDVFLTTSRAPRLASDWTRPHMLPNRAPFGISDPVLTWTGQFSLQLEFTVPAPERNGRTVLFPREPPTGPRPTGPQTWQISVLDVLRDRDGDGWTDIEENRLRMRSDVVDSDGDGIRDDADDCPNYAASPTEAADVEAAILKKVFFAGYGIHRAQDLLLVAGGSRPLQLWGSRGPVLYGIDRSEWIARWGAGPPILNWKLKALNNDSATVEFGDYEASLAAAGYTATLKRIDGEWFVVAIVMNWIS